MAATATKKIDLSGREKAAILLITLGPEKSSKVFKYLKEDEIEALTLEIANISSVMPETKESVINEFYQICLAQKYISEGGMTYARQILERALGEERANEVLSKLQDSLRVRPFEFIRKTEASQLINFIQAEHPQAIALIMSYMRPRQASEVLMSLPAEKQADVARRIALMDRTSPDVIREVEKALEKKLSTIASDDMMAVGGIDYVVDILNSVDRTTEKNIMEALEIEDVELSEEIKKRMFVFEDIITLDSRSIQTVLRTGIDPKDLAIALKSASEEVKAVIFANVSKRQVAMVQEEMEYMGPVRKSDVEEYQQKIVNIIRRLQDAGEIVIARGGSDDLVV